jgi:hypothetical protein
MAADMEEPLYSSRSIKIFAKDHDSFHTTRMNRQVDSGKHGRKLLFGVQLFGMKRPLTNMILKVWGPHVADEFTQCVR